MLTAKTIFHCTLLAGAAHLAMQMVSPAHAQSFADKADSNSAIDQPASDEMEADDAATALLDEHVIIVTGQTTSYNNNITTEAMTLQQSELTSALSRIDNLPGVSIQEGDAFGFDDWSTTIAIRGFQNSADDQQIGITVDGLPNGGSNYGGGSKANRYIDNMNGGAIQVSQGTADIGSLSNEALGGTIDFTTAIPMDDLNIRVSVSLAEHDALRFYGRVDTGDLGGIKGWISASHQEGSDWVNGAAENRRDHFAAKFMTTGPLALTGYVSHDDAHEDNYQRIFSAEAFAANPESDRLNAEWTGIPYVDQLYRNGWSTLRKNSFAYLKGEYAPVDQLKLRVAGYYHHLKGRGDWVPPYIVDVTDDGVGQPHSELTSDQPAEGGAIQGRIHYVDSDGRALTPAAGCQSSFTAHPYGPGGAENDPACYPVGAIGVQSYRHTHYNKDRYGATVDFDWTLDFSNGENNLRGGLWYEDGQRDEYRDWHRISDTRIGFAFDDPAYWTQYSLSYPQSTFKWWVEDSLRFGPLTANFGIKQFYNDLRREDHFDATQNSLIDSKSDVLFSGGLRLDASDSVNMFVGYAENFKALNDLILERPAARLDQLEPETSQNWEGGFRFNSGSIQASATFFHSKFDNRIIFLSANTTTGPNYLIGTSGSYFNAGGINSQGLEMLINARVTDGLNLYASYSHIDTEYRGSGDPLVDATQGIVPGNRVAGIAEDLFVISADYQTGPLHFGVSGKYTGSRYVDIGNDFATGDYFLTDAWLRVKGEAISDSLKTLSLGLTVNNLLDEDYLGGIAEGGVWIGAPRTFAFTATLDF